jgi:hypothetical protein
MHDPAALLMAFCPDLFVFRRGGALQDESS